MAYKILLAEDEPTMRRLMVMLLARQGHQVIEAEHGGTVVDLAQEYQPDIILLDIMMPMVDGYEALRRVRSTPGIDHIPAIFLSAKSQIEDRVEGLRLGADDYLIKPADPAELMARIESVLMRAKREAHRAKGQVYGFIGAKGGVGVTTTVVNLALSLHNTGKSVLAVDLHLAFGNLAESLHLDPPQTTANLALQPSESIDNAALQRILARHDCGLRVLAAPVDVPHGVTYSAEHLIAVVEQAAHTAQMVLLDLPPDPDIVEVLADQLNGVVLVTTNEPSARRATIRWARHLSDLGLHKGISYLLVKKALPFADKFADEAGEAAFSEELRCPLLGVIPYVFEIHANADQRQSPLLLQRQESPESAVYQQLASAMTKYKDIVDDFRVRRIMERDKLD